MRLLDFYPLLKGLHVAFMVTWFAGLFYLPRLFIYHAEANTGFAITAIRRQKCWSLSLPAVWKASSNKQTRGNDRFEV